MSEEIVKNNMTLSTNKQKYSQKENSNNSALKDTVFMTHHIFRNGM
jgi:hypothetical protein